MPVAPKRGSEGYGGIGTTRAQCWGWSPYADFTKHSPRVMGLVCERLADWSAIGRKCLEA
jgi:hypothetical protein